MENNNQSSCNDKESDYRSLANVLGIQIQELLSLEFHNENIFNEGGEIKQIKYVFSDANSRSTLTKIKGLDSSNAIILSVKDLECY